MSQLDIVNLLRKTHMPMTIKDIASALGVNGHTLSGRILTLERTKRIKVITEKVGTSRRKVILGLTPRMGVQS